MISYRPSKDDLRHLRPQLLFVLLATVSALALLAAAIQVNGQESARLLSAQTEGENLRQRIDHFAAEEAELREDVRQYADWGNRGILGAEQRITWIKILQEIRRRRHLVALHYEFAPQQGLGLSLLLPAGMPFHFVTSPMQLTATAVHEGDVVGLLEEIGEEVPAYVRPRRCLLERKRSEQSGASSVLQLDCQMDWITINRAP